MKGEPMKKIYFLVGVIFLIVVLLAACKDDPDPPVLTIQQTIDVTASNNQYSSLFAVAVKKSSVYQNLSGDHYPFTLLYPRKLRDYLKKQGITEQEFLASSKLDNFIRAHLILEIIDLDKASKEKISYKNVLGQTLIFEPLTQPTQQALAMVNGKNIDLSCAWGYRIPQRETPPKTARVCYTDEVAIEFSWDK